MTLEEQIAQTIRDNCDEPEVESIFAAAKAVVGLLRQGPTLFAEQCEFKPNCARFGDDHGNGIHNIVTVEGEYALVLLGEATDVTS